MTRPQHRDDELAPLLTGETPEGVGMAVLSEAFAAMRTTYATVPDAAYAAVFADRLAAVAAANPPGGGPVGATASTRRRAKRLSIAALTAGLAVTVFGGAATADQAAPGDILYPLDRALETLGVGDGGAEERLEEAQELAEDSDLEGALEVAGEAVGDMDHLDAADQDELVDLLVSAASVLSSGSEQSEERREVVAEMLAFMAETDLTGPEFGQAVADRARGLVAADADAVTEDVVPGGTEGVTSDDVVTDDEASADVADAPGNSENSNAGGNSSGSNAGGSPADSETDGDDATTDDDPSDTTAPGNSENSNAGGNSTSSSAARSSTTSNPSYLKAIGKPAGSNTGGSQAKNKG